jgi:hypothetical protein
MKCYEFHHNYPSLVKSGMTLTTDEQLGKIIFLGINNQKSKAVKVSLDRNNPAVVKDERVIEAWPRLVYTKQKTSFTVFQKPLRSSQDVLLRVNTSSAESDSVINGTWRSGSGEPKQVFTTNGRRKMTRFCDDILQLSPGDSIFVNLEGDEKEFELKNEKGRIKAYTDNGEAVTEINGNVKTECVQEVEKTAA